MECQKTVRPNDEISASRTATGWFRAFGFGASVMTWFCHTFLARLFSPELSRVCFWFKCPVFFARVNNEDGVRIGSRTFPLLEFRGLLFYARCTALDVPVSLLLRTGDSAIFIAFTKPLRRTSISRIYQFDCEVV